MKPEWLQSAATRQAVVGELSGTVLAILPSSLFQHVAVVAIPPEAYLHDFAGTRWAVAAAGGIAGVMLCGVILWRKRWPATCPSCCAGRYGTGSSIWSTSPSSISGPSNG